MLDHNSILPYLLDLSSPVAVANKDLYGSPTKHITIPGGDWHPALNRATLGPETRL